MHAVTHSLAHRAPPATRTRVRWQPYNSLPSSSSASSSTSRSPTTTYLHTPASSVTSSPPISTPLCDIDRLRQALPPAISQPPKELPLRDAPKTKLGLVGEYICPLHQPTAWAPLLTNERSVDQAVKALCEIWRPQDIPAVFLTSSKAMAFIGLPAESAQISHLTIANRNTQLPSPISPTTTPSPPSTTSPTTQALLQQSEADADYRSNVVPIKGFVHEVLRRSRTSQCVLQTALCYLEAIRAKVPELVREVQAGEGVKGELEIESRILPATEAELEQDAELSMRLDEVINTVQCAADTMDTIRVTDDNIGCVEPTHCVSPDGALLDAKQKPKAPSPPLAPLPPLPSPLLCPRRAFLASLILASKFTQDKCYSNRAWAKLSGLPPREIGRCERALGEALDWRLWVGKTPVAAAVSPAPPSAVVQRPLVRCQSEVSLSPPPPTSRPLVSLQADWRNASTVAQPPIEDKFSGNSRALRKCATLPADMFSRHLSRSDTIGWGLAHELSASNIAKQDQYMDCTDQSLPGSDGNSGFQSNTAFTSVSELYTEKFTQSPKHGSPSPGTPGLSYSPSSTESSSSGDRTIQMTTFLDDNMSYNSSQPFVATDAWQWLDNADGKVNPFIPDKVSPPFGGRATFVSQRPPRYYPDAIFMQNIDALLANPGLDHRVSHGPDLNGSYPWRSENSYLPLGCSY